MGKFILLGEYRINLAEVLHIRQEWGKWPRAETDPVPFTITWRNGWEPLVLILTVNQATAFNQQWQRGKGTKTKRTKIRYE